jgi:hypothetical protein
MISRVNETYLHRRQHPSLRGVHLLFQDTLPKHMSSKSREYRVKHAYRSKLTVNRLANRTTTVKHRKLLTKHKTACTKERMHEV